MTHITDHNKWRTYNKLVPLKCGAFGNWWIMYTCMYVYTVQTTSNCLVISVQLIILHKLKYWIPHLNAYKNSVLGTYMQIALSGVVAYLWCRSMGSNAIVSACAKVTTHLVTYCIVISYIRDIFWKMIVSLLQIVLHGASLINHTVVLMQLFIACSIRVCSDKCVGSFAANDKSLSLI